MLAKSITVQAVHPLGLSMCNHSPGVISLAIATSALRIHMICLKASNPRHSVCTSGLHQLDLEEKGGLGPNSPLSTLYINQQNSFWIYPDHHWHIIWHPSGKLFIMLIFLQNRLLHRLSSQRYIYILTLLSELLRNTLSSNTHSWNEPIREAGRQVL